MDDEESMIEAMIQARADLPAELVGGYLAATDWAIGGETYRLIARLWASHRGCVRIEPGHTYRILPDLHRAWATAALVAVIPLNPDDPETMIDDAFGLWQLRDPGHPPIWQLLTDKWLSAHTIRPVE